MFPTDQPSDISTLSAAMERYARGDERAFSQVHCALAPRLYAFLLQATHNPAEAHDLLQQTFLQIHCARSRYLPGTDPAPWFFTIARRVMIDMRRKCKFSASLSTDLEEGCAIPPALISEPCADERCYSKELELQLRRKLGFVPEKQRVAFELVKFAGLSYEEAADALGTTIVVVRVRIHRVCRWLLETSQHPSSPSKSIGAEKHKSGAREPTRLARQGVPLAAAAA
jgi:RNA polymerase sigma-70 factor (ECF subfamily)